MGTSQNHARSRQCLCIVSQDENGDHHQGLLMSLKVYDSFSLMRSFTWFLFLLCTGCFTTKQLAQPAGEPLVVEAAKFPHEVFDGVLKRVVNENGQVDYKSLHADRLDLEKYIYALQTHSPHSNPELFPSDADKLAYWINAYNAIVLYSVTEQPKLKSVIDDKFNFFGFTEHTLGKAGVSLHKLENEIVRKEFNEPRIHMALNCASGGCPELPAEAFTPGKLEEQLTREATEFCKHPQKVRMNGEVAEVSEIFKFYEADFPEGPVKFCIKWGNDQLKPEAKWTYIPYDWSMNAQTGKAMFD